MDPPCPPRRVRGGSRCGPQSSLRELGGREPVAYPHEPRCTERQLRPPCPPRWERGGSRTQQRAVNLEPQGSPATKTFQRPRLKCISQQPRPYFKKQLLANVRAASLCRMHPSVILHLQDSMRSLDSRDGAPTQLYRECATTWAFGGVPTRQQGLHRPCARIGRTMQRVTRKT